MAKALAAGFLCYPRTETPEKESTAKPRTGWPKKRAGSKWLDNSRFSTCARVLRRRAGDDAVVVDLALAVDVRLNHHRAVKRANLVVAADRR